METRRKVVTVVFADVVGSTALGERVDSETLRWAMQRWFDRMRVAVERHGGTIENCIGHGHGRLRDPGDSLGRSRGPGAEAGPR